MSLFVYYNYYYCSTTSSSSSFSNSGFRGPASHSNSKAPMRLDHPAVAPSLANHSSWEQALASPAAPDSDHPLLTAHPAVGACRAECLAWEHALGSSGTQQHGELTCPGGGWYAVVECGSHSTRLLLSTGSADILRLTKDTHLGAVASTAAASATAAAAQPDAAAGTTVTQDRQDEVTVPAAAAATMQAVQEYARILQQHQQQLRVVLAVATAAVRESPEGPQIAAAIGQALQCPVHVLTAAQEAQLAFKGATCSLATSSSGANPADRLCLVVDLGGRSTELALGVAGKAAQQTASIPLGCLGVQQAGGSDGCSTGGQRLLKAAQGILDAHRASLADISTALEAARQQQQQQQPSQQQVQSSQVAVVVTGGTATTLAALHLELEEYCHEAVHMSVLTRQQVEQLMQQYLKQSFVQGPPASMSSDSSAGDGRGGRGRSDWPSWLTPARASSLAPGCAGLLVLMDWLGCQELVVSDCDLLDGAVAHMQQEGAALTWGL